MSETRTLDAPALTKLERARAIIAGTLTEPVLEPSPLALASLEKAFEMNGVVPTPKARREQMNFIALTEQYAGRGPVLTYDTGDGQIVLAVGWDEISPITEGMSRKEAERLAVEYPVDPFGPRYY
jgi:hypothetical protein